MRSNAVLPANVSACMPMTTPRACSRSAASNARSIHSSAAASRAATSASRSARCAGVSAPPNHGARPLSLPTTWTSA